MKMNILIGVFFIDSHNVQHACIDTEQQAGLKIEGEVFSYGLYSSSLRDALMSTMSPEKRLEFIGTVVNEDKLWNHES